jgi:glycosyltransferase involved in cell wall biosynthesis
MQREAKEPRQFRCTTIIPTYNQQALLRETLSSVWGMQRVPDEVIVVDDGSTDGTREMLAAEGRVRLLQQANAGSAAARNAGLSASTGEYVYSLDHDDLLAPHCLEEVQRAFQLFPEAGAMWINFSVFGHEPVDDFLKQSPHFHDPFGFAGALERTPGTERDGCKFIPAEAAARLLCETGPQSNSAIIYRRDVLAGWDARLCLGDDWGALFRALLKGPFAVVVVRRVCWHKRVASHNTSKQRGVGMLERQRKELEAALTEYAPKLPSYAMKRLRSHLAENYMSAGWGCSAKGKLTDCLQWYGRALRVKPHWKPVWWAMRALVRRLTGASSTIRGGKA